MSDKIKVLIADDVEETRKNIITLLEFEDKIEVVGQAQDGQEAIDLTEELQPDIVLMDINMPVLDGLRATEQINIQFPDIAVIIMSVQGEKEYFKKAMYHGAKEYIVKPFSLDILIETIIKTYEKERKKKDYRVRLKEGNEKKKDPKVVTIFSTKGGVGKTTISVNTAISIAKETGDKVAILDLDLQFGDVSVMLNLSQRKNISDAIEEIGHLNSDILNEYMTEYMKDVKVLASPPTPEYAEYILPSHIEKIIEILKQDYQYIVIDSSADFSDIMLTALDISDQIIFLSTMDLPTIKNVKLGLDIMNSLNYPEEKIKVAVNKVSKLYSIKTEDIQQVLNKKVNICIPEDNKTVIISANKGYPFMRSRGDNKISRAIKALGELVITGKEQKQSNNIVGNFLSKKKLNLSTN